jgi:pimeloyl-ACP methyl ester carboxylesterase
MATQIANPFDEKQYTCGRAEVWLASKNLTHRNLTMTRDGIVLSAILVQTTDSISRGLVSVLHGVGDSRDLYVGDAAFYVLLGFDVLLPDARAHGASGGKCSYGVYERWDLVAWFDLLGSLGLLPDTLILQGFSLGAAIALDVAAIEPRVDAVISLAPFADFENAAETHWNQYAGFVPHWLRDMVHQRAEESIGFRMFLASPMHYVRAIKAPVLYIHGTEDRRIPVWDSRYLNAMTPDSRLIEVVGADHDGLLAAISPWFGDTITNFLNCVFDKHLGQRYPE